MFHLAATPLRRSTSGIATVHLVVGGKLQAVLEHGRRFGRTLILGADVRGELKSALPDGPPDGVVLLPLADVATVRSLLDGAPDDLQRAMKQYPGVSLSGGLGQVITVGWLAGCHAVKSRDFTRWLNECLLDQIMRWHEGHLSGVQILADHSGGGGTGSGAGEVATEVMASLFRKCGIRTSIEVRLTGSLSYLELGPRIHRNTAACALGWLEFVGAVDCPSTESRALSLDELPATGTNKSARDGYALLAAQGRDAPETREHLERFSANHLSRSQLGAVRIEQLGFWGPLPPKIVAENIAPPYIEELQELAAIPPSAAMDRVVTLCSAREQEVEPVDRIYRRLGALSETDLLADLGRPLHRYDVEVEGETPDGGKVNLSRAAEIFGVACQAPEDFRRRLRLFRSADDLLVLESESLAKRLEEYTDWLADAREVVLGAAARALGHVWFDPRTWFSNEERRHNDFCLAADNYRSAHDQWLRGLAEHEAVLHAITAVRAEIGHLEQRLDRVRDLLKPLLSRSPEEQPKLVVPLPLAEVLPRLLGLANSDAAMKVLAGSVAACTVAGLADLLGSDSPRLADVISGLASAHPAVEAPFWGSQEITLVPPQRILILPPVEDRVERQLKSDFAALDSDRELAIADTAVGGVGIVEIRVYFPRDVHGVITPFLRHHFREALDHEKALYFPKGLGPLAQELAADTSGESVFPNQPS